MKEKHVSRRFFNRNFLTAIIACGMVISFYSISSSADEVTNTAATPPTITIDINKPVSVNYQEINKFNSYQNVSRVRFFKAENGHVILSDQPILLADKQTNYFPSSLKYLGYEIDDGQSLTKIDPYQLPENIATVTEIPEYIPVKTSAPVSVTHSSEPEPVHIHGVITSETLNMVELISMLLAAAGFTTASVLLLIMFSRYTKSIRKSPIFSGAISSNNEMVGKGNAFNFNGNNLTKRPIHTTYMDMMWQLGRLSHNNSVDTYFYMAIFIPSYRNYARILRRKIAEKTKETHTI